MDEFDNYTLYIVATIMAIWGGSANYISRIGKDESLEFKTAELMGEWVVSGFAGVCAYLICIYYGVPELLSIAFAGIAGHQGSRTIFILELWIKHKFRVYKDNKND